jgi:hypothetical protein
MQLYATNLCNFMQLIMQLYAINYANLCKVCNFMQVMQNKKALSQDKWGGNYLFNAFPRQRPRPRPRQRTRTRFGRIISG